MTRVLVPVAILERGAVSSGLASLLSTTDVTVLGYHVLPEQTPPDQARAQYEERAVSALEDIVEEFAAAGGDAEFRLVFTHDREKTIDRVADETGSTAYVITGTTGDVDRLLVPLAGDVAVDRILGFVTELVGDREIDVTLLLAVDDEAADEGRALLENAAERLTERGIGTATTLSSDRPFDALADALPSHDAVVVGEAAPSLTSLLLGDVEERVADATVGPVLVVRAVDSPSPSR